MQTLGYWTVIPICLTHVTFAALAVVFFKEECKEEWCIFMEMVVWLGLDAVVAVEGVPHIYFEEQHKGFGEQVSTATLSTLTLSGVLSFALGGVIYEYCGWTGMAIFHVSAQGVITLLLLAMSPPWKSLMKQFAGRDAERPLQPILPESDASKEEEPEKPRMSADEGTDTFQLPGVVEEENDSVERSYGVSGGCQEEQTGIAEKGLAPSATTNEQEKRPPKATVRESMNTPPSSRVQSTFEKRGTTMRVSKMSAATGGSSGLARQSTRGSTMGRMFTQSIACRTTLQLDAKRVTNWSQSGKQVDLIDIDTEFVKDKELRISFAHRSKVSPFDPSGLLPDVRFPLFLVVLCSGAISYSLLAQLVSFALLLAQYWSTSTALWAGLAQSGGEVLAMILGMLKSWWEASLQEDLEGEDEDSIPRRGAVCRCLSFLNTEPYSVSLHVFFFALSSYCFIIPHPAGLVTAQLFMSSCYGFAAQSAQDVYALYCCLSHPELMYTVMRLGYSAEVFGGLVAGVLTLSLITISAEISIPFIISGSICLLIGLLYTIGFCRRVGMDLLTAEADRAL